jgi:HSP20 family molecular chaperone IbpA
MKLAATALILALAAAPRETGAWCGRSPYTSMVRPVVVFSPAAATEWRQRKVFNRRGCTQTSPRYEITDNDDFFQVAVDVPGMTANDISITIEEDGNLLSVKGTRQSRSDAYSFSSKFSQSFSLDPSVDVHKFTAKLENGVLIIAAPKDLKRIEENIRSIPITTVTGKEDPEATSQMESEATTQMESEATTPTEADSVAKADEATEKEEESE